jgi:TolB-like protein/Tfp pilus assembly protein PilF
MITSGLPALDEALGGGFPSGSTVVLLGSSTRARDSLGYRILRSGVMQGEFGVYVTKLKVSEVLRDAGASGVDLATNPPYWVAGEGGDAKYSTELSALSFTIKEALKMSGGRKIMVVFEELSALLTLNPAESMFRFLEQLLAGVKRFDALLLAMLDPEMHSTQVVASTEHLFDGAIEVTPAEDRSGGITLKVKKMRGATLRGGALELSAEFQAVSRTEATRAPMESKRLAVLPFLSTSPEPGDDYFADGMTEEMISATSKIDGLSVISRTSSMKFKGSGKSVDEIRRELNVGSVLEGSVRKAGDRVRVSVQLIDASEDKNLWSEVYDRELKDIFSIQEEIAQSIAGALKSRLLEGGISMLRERRTENLDAYTKYLRGRHLWNRRTKAATDEAIRLFNDALEIDPRYARAYSGLADCYFTAVSWGLLDEKEGLPKAREFANRAVQLDDALPEPHATLGPLYISEMKYEEGEREFRRAISLNPDYATAHLWYGFHLRMVGRLDEGLAENERACELDPLSAINLWHHSLALMYSGRLDDAIERCRKAVELEPGFFAGHFSLSTFFARKNDRTGALRHLERFDDLTSDEYDRRMARAEVLGILGEKKGALETIGGALPAPDAHTLQVQARRRENQNPELTLLAIYGDKDGFFRWTDLMSGGSDRSLGLTHLWSDIRYDPLLAGIREDPRASQLFAKYGLTL